MSLWQQAASGAAAGWWGLPEVVFHWLAVAAVRTVPRGVALTFDDGPGPLTPRFLDVLGEHGVRATFFCLGDAARQAPDVVRRMVREGHTVGSHLYRHRPTWLMGPVATWRQVKDSVAALEDVTGVPVRYVRPPWGQHNLALPAVCALLGRRRVLWSLAPGDWWGFVPAEEIARRVVQRAREGSVVLLHDAGGDGRARTLAALPAMLEGLRGRGLTPLALEEALGPTGGRGVTRAAAPGVGAEQA